MGLASGGSGALRLLPPPAAEVLRRLAMDPSEDKDEGDEGGDASADSTTKWWRLNLQRESLPTGDG